MNKLNWIYALAFLGILQTTRSSAQTVTDDGSTAPSNFTYSQPVHGSSGGTGVADATAGVGEEFTLSATDPTLVGTDIYVKSSGGANPSPETLSWTLNLYNLTNSTQLPSETFSSLLVNPSDYLDFTLNLTPQQGQLIGGDTYAFTLTSSSSWYLAGVDKSSSSDVTPTGITSEFAVAGNGTGSSLTAVDTVNGGGDLTYYLQTTSTPEPPASTLLFLGVAGLGLGGRLRRISSAAAR